MCSKSYRLYNKRKTKDFCGIDCYFRYQRIQTKNFTRLDKIKKYYG